MSKDTIQVRIDRAQIWLIETIDGYAVERVHDINDVEYYREFATLTEALEGLYDQIRKELQLLPDVI
uniref:Uncharacterized protein n=1 Tax=viral metagenome TaxID=1070528 RepID=A0A6M3L402_9ZZZZ